MAQFDIFISHDTRDKQLAYQLNRVLDRIGIIAYVYEFYPQYRNDIPTAIVDVLESPSCHVCLCLLTRNGIESLWVHQELGAAYALKKVIIPVLELGIDYGVKGFVQYRTHIDYDPMNFDSLAYEVIWALRNEFFGHDQRPSLTLKCSCGLKRDDYLFPSTHEINEAIVASIKPDQIIAFKYKCSKCGAIIEVSPWTFEQLSP